MEVCSWYFSFTWKCVTIYIFHQSSSKAVHVIRLYKKSYTKYICTYSIYLTFCYLPLCRLKIKPTSLKNKYTFSPRRTSGIHLWSKTDIRSNNWAPAKDVPLANLSIMFIMNKAASAEVWGADLDTAQRSHLRLCNMMRRCTLGRQYIPVYLVKEWITCVKLSNKHLSSRTNSYSSLCESEVFQLLQKVTAEADVLVFLWFHGWQ